MSLGLGRGRLFGRGFLRGERLERVGGLVGGGVGGRVLAREELLHRLLGLEEGLLVLTRLQKKLVAFRVEQEKKKTKRVSTGPVATRERERARGRCGERERRVCVCVAENMSESRRWLAVSALANLTAKTSSTSSPSEKSKTDQTQDLSEPTCARSTPFPK